MYNVQENINSKYHRNPTPVIEAIKRTDDKLFSITDRKGNVSLVRHKMRYDNYFVMLNVKTKRLMMVHKEDVATIKANGVIITFDNEAG